jgi:hypothetical protein
LKPDFPPAGVIAHFGMPKTGTTSIQLSLMRRLADERFHYLKLGHANASYAIANAFKTEAHKFHRHRKEGTSPERLSQLRREAADHLNAELDAAAGRTAILSAEVVFTFDESELNALCRALARGGPLRVAGYVRRPKEFMESLFQQGIRGGRGNFAVDRLFPRYRQRLQTLDTVFGRGNTLIWPYVPASFPAGCVVQDFCRRLGIAFPSEHVTRTNESLSLPALSLLYAYRKFGPGYGVGPQVMRENKLLVRSLRGLPGPKVRLHSSVVAPVLQARRSEIEWVEERISASLAEDPAAHDEHAVRSESDLLVFSPDSLAWLAGQLGEAYASRRHRDMSPTEVAGWMHLLRAKVAAEQEARRSSRAA